MLRCLDYGLHNLSGSMLGILCTFFGVWGSLYFLLKRSFFLPRVMWAKVLERLRLMVQGLGGYCPAPVIVR